MVVMVLVRDNFFRANGYCTFEEKGVAKLVFMINYNCTTYCQAMVTKCPFVYAPVYGAGNTVVATPEQSCEFLCALWPVGLETDLGGSGSPPTPGNTLSCRWNHVGFVNASDTSTLYHCGHAAPSGGQTPTAAGVCGNYAYFYCDFAFSTLFPLVSPCNGSVMYGYPGVTRQAAYDACVREASTWRVNGTSTLATPLREGDNVECRVAMIAFSLPLAAPPAGLDNTGTPPKLCSAATWAGGVAGAQYCGTACSNFCYDYQKTCGYTTAAYPFASNTSCWDACNGWNQNAAPSNNANTIGCRKWLLQSVRAGTMTAANACAATGTVSTVCMNAASGVSPVFALIAFLAVALFKLF